MTLLDQLSTNTSRGSWYEEDEARGSEYQHPSLKLIAFYLPQFHAILENNLWWGEGFTEWTNVTKAIPRFSGHYQPRLPGAFGFYNSTQPEVLERQVETAKSYGVSGFCFHHYWFNGKRLLEKPLDLLLSRSDIKMPFCINWANESWTRRWDGHEKDILQAQKHSADDDLAFARSIEPILEDARYIRIGGRPLIILYRPGILPNAQETVERWRTHFASVGLGNPYIAMVQAFGDGDAAKYGMDAAVSFPPFWAGGIKREDQLKLLDPKYKGSVFDYERMADATAAGYSQYKNVFPGVCPSWDNEARKPNKGSCFQGSTPEKYGQWLGSACKFSMQNLPKEEQFVFINAWNEWAEGAYLEPDRHFGYAYLMETARVLRRLDANSKASTKVLVSSNNGDKGRQTTFLERKLRASARKLLNKTASLFEDISWKLRRF